MAHITRHPCDQCGASYDSESALREHKKTSHRTSGSEEYVPVSGSNDPETKREDQKKPLLDDWGKSDKH